MEMCPFLRFGINDARLEFSLSTLRRFCSPFQSKPWSQLAVLLAQWEYPGGEVVSMEKPEKKPSALGPAIADATRQWGTLKKSQCLFMVSSFAGMRSV